MGDVGVNGEARPINLPLRHANRTQHHATKDTIRVIHPYAHVRTTTRNAPGYRLNPISEQRAPKMPKPPPRQSRTYKRQPPGREAHTRSLHASSPFVCHPRPSHSPHGIVAYSCHLCGTTPAPLHALHWPRVARSKHRISSSSLRIRPPRCERQAASTRRFSFVAASRSLMRPLPRCRASLPSTASTPRTSPVAMSAGVCPLRPASPSR